MDFLWNINPSNLFFNCMQSNLLFSRLNIEDLNKCVNPFTTTDRFRSIQYNEWKSPLKLLSVERVNRCVQLLQICLILIQQAYLIVYRYSEKSKTKCIGITIETRPDYCLRKHMSDMLKYGCTRQEIGVQSVYEDVARDTNRYVYLQIHTSTNIFTDSHECKVLCRLGLKWHYMIGPITPHCWRLNFYVPSV